MAVNVRDLPPEYQAQALRKYMEQQRQEGPPFPAVSEPQKESKYHNRPTDRVTASGSVLHLTAQKRPDAMIAWPCWSSRGGYGTCASK